MSPVIPTRKLFRALWLLALINVVGVGGYMYFENYSFEDALYMTIQTVSTVGFNEVQPFTGGGKYFTIFLILTSFGTFAYGASIIVQIVFDGSLASYYKYYRVQGKIDKLENHVIICGFGRNGKQVARKLKAYKQSFVVVDLLEERMSDFDPGNMLYLIGNASSDDVLERAGVHRAKAVVASLATDADNLFVVVTAKQLNPSLNIVARANEETSKGKLIAAGATSTVMPNEVGGSHMADNLKSPDVVEFIDHLSVGGSSETNIEEILVNDILAENTQQISDLDIRRTTGCTVIGYKTEDGDFEINPGADVKLTPNSKLFVLGTTDQIKKLQKLFS
jgi:voltage-gated potassium channel